MGIETRSDIGVHVPDSVQPSAHEEQFGVIAGNPEEGFFNEVGTESPREKIERELASTAVQSVIEGRTNKVYTTPQMRSLRS